MDVLVTGADTSVGRKVAETFRAAGHQLVITGADRAKLEAAAGDLGAEAVVCDCADPASLADAQSRIPHHLDAVVIVPDSADSPAGSTLADTAATWRHAFDRTVISAVLTVQTVADHLRSGGSIVTVLPAGDTDAPGSAAKAALSSWTAGQADHFGIRGIIINTVAAGRAAEPGYPGLTGTPPSAADEIARLALFLSTPAARHITGQTLHVGRGAAVAYG